MTQPFLLIDRDGAVLTVRMNRPASRNALTDLSQMDEFVALARQVRGDRSVKAVVLTGEGSAFCAGGNVKDMRDRGGIFAGTPCEVRDSYRDTIQRIPLAIYELDVPIIAAVNGPAAGGGMCLALASDVVLANEKASFTPSFINIGLSGGEMGTSYFLPRAVGMPRAAEILLTGRTVGAAEAERIGLINRLVPGDTLLEVAMETGRRMLAKSPAGLRLTKEVLNANMDAPSLEAAIELENRNQSICCFTPEFLEAIMAFRNRRT